MEEEEDLSQSKASQISRRGEKTTFGGLDRGKSLSNRERYIGKGERRNGRPRS